MDRRTNSLKVWSSLVQGRTDGQTHTVSHYKDDPIDGHTHKMRLYAFVFGTRRDSPSPVRSNLQEMDGQKDVCGGQHRARRKLIAHGTSAPQTSLTERVHRKHDGRQAQLRPGSGMTHQSSSSDRSACSGITHHSA